MPKRNFLYILIGGVILVILTLVAVSIFTKPKPVKPTITGQVTEKEPLVSQEPIPELEEKPVEVPVTPEVTPKPLPPLKERVMFKPEFQKGMTFVAWTQEGYSNPNSVKAMEQLASLGVEWVSLSPTWFQYQYNSTKIERSRDKTPSDESLIFAIRKLHELKFKVMLKPHLDIVDGNGKWRGDIGCTLVEDWQAWFDSYANFILHYARLAEEENVESFCIGTELVNSTYCKPELWREVIKKVREVYTGALTYAANWSEEFEAIEFWNDLDYAGIDAYFPLVTSASPTIEQLSSAWEDWLRSIEPWQKKINKPVVITEVGYKSVSGANEEPWQHSSSGEVDLQLQVNCYEALLQAFWDKPWFYGIYWWYWGVNPKMGGSTNRSFTPQNKPAQEVIKEWYKKNAVRIF